MSSRASPPSKDSQTVGPQQSEHRRPIRPQLSEEEKAVLIECRRNSTARGLPLGVGALLTLRWFVRQGRVPGHITRWTGLYYTGAFLGGFYVGVASYKQRCVDKIMALDNSILKDQVLKEIARARGHESYGDEETQSSAPQFPRDRPSPPRPSYPSPTRNTPHTRKPDVTLPEGPSIKTGYEKDRRMLETQEDFVEQPDAFGGAGYQLNPQPDTGQSYEEQPSKQRGRSYDDVRESARRRYQETRGDRKREEEEDWRRQQQQRRRVVRKNKYGDDIEE